jgi:hypothetical protein
MWAAFKALLIAAIFMAGLLLIIFVIIPLMSFLIIFAVTALIAYAIIKENQSDQARG